MIRPRNKNPALLLVTLFMVFGVVNLGAGIASNAESMEPSLRGSLDPGGYISDIDDYGFDENNDTSYDKLFLGMWLHFDASGIYQIYADMTPSGVMASDDIRADFQAGDHYVELNFNGSTIYNSGRNGPYTINISIYKGPQPISYLDYKTSDYKYEDFNPNPTSFVPEKASIEVVNNTVRLKTEIFEAVIYELTPKIIFFYTSDEGKVARFKVSYNRIICFNDGNKDNDFQEDELRYFADLKNTNWNSQKILMENFNSFDFKVQTIVNLLDATNSPIDTKLKLAFHYSSFTEIGDLKDAQKFDIAIKVLGSPLADITHITLEHSLVDEMGNHVFIENDAGSEPKISFNTPEGNERGYYSWKNSFEAETGDDSGSEYGVSYNLEETSEESVMKLYLNYHYLPEMTELFHDPVVGVNPLNKPMIPGSKPEEVINHEIFIYIVVAAIAAVIMIGNIYRQKSKKGL